MLTDVAIWKGVESLKRSCTFFVTSFPYIKLSKEMTSSSGSFNSGSSNNDGSVMSAYREGRDADFSTIEGSSEEAAAFPFPFTPVRTTQGGRGSRPFAIFIPPCGRGVGRRSSGPPLSCVGGRRSFRGVVLA